MTLDDAFKVFGWFGGAPWWPKHLRERYAFLVKDAHPDTGSRRDVSIQELQEAYKLLLEALESQKCACKLCRGVGQVRSGMGWRSCSACDGTGETR